MNLVVLGYNARILRRHLRMRPDLTATDGAPPPPRPRRIDAANELGPAPAEGDAAEIGWYFRTGSTDHDVMGTPHRTV